MMNFKLGDENHAENMMNFGALLNAQNFVNGSGEEIPKPVIPQSELDAFGNWTGQTDTVVMAKDLQKRGLIGAEQLVNTVVDTTDAASIRNAQSDWKPAAIQQILSNARKLNLRTPEEINANRDVLISNPKWKDAINNPYFKQVHPNWWGVITDSILPEQYAKTESKTDTAKK